MSSLPGVPTQPPAALAGEGLQRRAFVAAGLMAAASIAAVLARPKTLASSERSSIGLEQSIPVAFGEWQEVQPARAQVVNPQTQELIDKLYSEVLTRVYINPNGYRMMLSIAYGSDQRGGLQAHKPEVCYPAQGFVLQSSEPARLDTPFGEIPVRRMFATLGPRQEPITYWFTVGDQVVASKTQKRIVDLMFGLTGRVPDGLLFRVSSIDADRARAFELQAGFVNQLLAAVSPQELTRLSGLRKASQVPTGG